GRSRYGPVRPEESRAAGGSGGSARLVGLGRGRRFGPLALGVDGADARRLRVALARLVRRLVVAVLGVVRARCHAVAPRSADRARLPGGSWPKPGDRARL